MNTTCPDTWFAAARRRVARVRTSRGLLAGLPPVMVVVALFDGGCERRPIGDGLPPAVSCSSCHGGPDNAAPPKGINGSTDTSTIGVGAHQTHMRGTTSSAPVACDECHPVPQRTDEPGHPNLTTDVLFGPLASASLAAPVWDRATATCKGAYCHGATLSGSGTRGAPVWTVVDGSQSKCTSCHGNPPQDGSHAAHSFMACGECHAPTLDLDDRFQQPALHVDGQTQVSMPAGGSWDGAAKTCSSTGASCHGSEPYPW